MSENIVFVLELLSNSFVLTNVWKITKKASRFVVIVRKTFLMEMVFWLPSGTKANLKTFAFKFA